MYTMKRRCEPKPLYGIVCVTFSCGACFAWLLVVTGCGQTALDRPRAGTGGGQSGAAIAGNPNDAFGGSSSAANAGGDVPDQTTSGAFNAAAGEAAGGRDAAGGNASSIPDAARGDCILYRGFVRGYVAERAAAGGAPSGVPNAGMPPAGTLGPCGECIAACSREAVPGCEVHSDCVTRHCTCEGCEDKLPYGDFCACVETCNGPRDQACLNSWVDYAVCVSQSCANRCPAN
jgi:hypothetical protein